jgi:uracil-DNA glycosylase
MNDQMEVNIENSWKEVLKKEFEKEYFIELARFIKEEYTKYQIFPKGKEIFKAFEFCTFEQVKVVILGQDPYHGDGQAHGLCFSVPHGMNPPPSLQNIYKELNTDIGKTIPNTGNLEHWAKQGVLLLNATLTVRAHQAGSHQNKGWETFTDAVIQNISELKNNVVFLLWGSYAQNKGKVIKEEKHAILKSAHPSPFSAYHGFFGKRHFSQANAYLRDKGIKEIEW